MSAQVLIGQSYYLRFDPKLYRARQPYPPLGSLYAASYLQSLGYSVAFFDAILAESVQEWRRALQTHTPRFAVLFEDNFNYLSKMCLLRMRQAAFEMIGMAREAGCTVIVCGADAADHAAAYLRRGADFVLRGEGEITLGELLGVLCGRSAPPLAEIAGLAYLPGRVGVNGSPGFDRDEIFLTAPRPDLRELDSLPFPAWELVDIDAYRGIWRRAHGYFSMNMVTTRGCPFHCNWCAKPIWGQRYNVRSPQNVAAELAWLKQTYQPDHIWFVDDILGLKPGWLDEFAGLVEQNNLRTPFKCLSRVDLLLRDGAVPALKRAGAQIVWVGAESGSQKILNAMEKGTTVEQIRQAAGQLRRHGIQVGFFLQFGYPGETWEDIQQTLRLVWATRPDDIGISVSYPLPGTTFYRRVQEQLGEKQNWYDSDDLAMLFHGPFNTRFYRQLHRRVHREYRLRKAGRALAQSLRGGQFLSRRTLKTLAQVVYHALQLPLDLWRLERLARQGGQAPRELQGAMSLEEASRPTPQRDM
jgi:radical SAM superfamily enzyme YgiQ (UPF0313 family)